ncbi:hypothetical protein HC752_09910 [Vibrio sp. S9_S30]|uniref:hypothetical protein n=1 Tax=Vibrio sp. S9_S30 TaxID=2720226 RepID=UPI0016819E1D|nr:hypothetical protein [Vibrio sp. S9_S30]MBD1557257.1 hypothetical protein [Vibrio sp. S9_S30]
MQESIHSVIHTVTSQLEDSPIKDLLSSALKSCIDEKTNELDMLLMAKKEGQISDEAFQIELEREKQIVEAEMLTWQIAAKADVQKVVNKTFHALAQTIL